MKDWVFPTKIFDPIFHSGDWQATRFGSLKNAVSVRTTRSGDAFEKDLLNYDIHGGLLEEDYRQLRNDSELATEVVLILLEKDWPGNKA